MNKVNEAFLKETQVFLKNTQKAWKNINAPQELGNHHIIQIENRNVRGEVVGTEIIMFGGNLPTRKAAE